MPIARGVNLLFIYSSKFRHDRVFNRREHAGDVDLGDMEVGHLDSF